MDSAHEVVFIFKENKVLVKGSRQPVTRIFSRSASRSAASLSFSNPINLVNSCSIKFLDFTRDREMKIVQQEQHWEVRLRQWKCSSQKEGNVDCWASTKRVGEMSDQPSSVKTFNMVNIDRTVMSQSFQSTSGLATWSNEFRKWNTWPSRWLS